MTLALFLYAPVANSAGDATFNSSRQAMEWLARELPRLTLANPKYRSKADGTVSQWLTKSVGFSRDGEGQLHIAMEESFTQTKAGVSTLGRHKAAFSLADVNISDLTGPGDVTPEGQPSRGILFTCKQSGCINAVWGAQASSGDKTDISLQDDASRAKTLAAFRYLATHSH